MYSQDLNDRENFVQYQMIDHQQQGLVAGTFEYPAGWQAGCNILWNYQNINSPVSVNAWAVNPNKFEMFEFLPMQTFVWTEPDSGMYATGQNMGGLIKMPPMSPEDGVRNWMLPTFCGNRENLSLVGINVEQVTDRPPDLRFQSLVLHQVSVRVEYTEKGLQVEEEYQFLHQMAQFPPISGFFGMTQTISWSLAEFCRFRTEKGRLDEMRETFSKIKSSLRNNPQWQHSIQQMAQMLINNSKQEGDDIIDRGWQNIGFNQQRINENAARNQAYIDEQQRRIDAMPTTPPSSMNFNSNSGYDSNDAFIDAIREEHSIYNPENPANEKVSIHDGDYIWKNERGDVQTSNDPNYDPNPGSNWNWTPAQKKKIGD